MKQSYDKRKRRITILIYFKRQNSSISYEVICGVIEP
jgi:hypothetical protein